MTVPTAQPAPAAPYYESQQQQPAYRPPPPRDSGMFSLGRVQMFLVIGMFVFLIGAIIAVGSKDTSFDPDQEDAVAQLEKNNARFFAKIGLVFVVAGLAIMAAFSFGGAIGNPDWGIHLRIALIAWTIFLMLMSWWVIATAPFLIEAARVWPG